MSDTPITDGDEYEVIPDDTEADIEGEHPDGDYPAEVYNDNEFDDEIDESDVAEEEEA